MKHYLLSLMALTTAMFTSASAWAQWSEPQEVVPAFTNEAVEPEDGGVYFLYNEATNLYVGAGNNWGTHVVATNLSEEPEILPTYWNQSIGLGGGAGDQGKGTVLPMQLTKLESGNWYIEHLGTDRGNRYLSSENGDSWIDCDNARRIDFIFAAVEGGYTIQASNTVTAGTYFGIVDGDVTPTMDAPIVSLNVMNNIASGERAVWKFLKTNYKEWKAYNARLSMYEFYQEIETSGYEVDLSAAKQIYDKADATEAELANALMQMRITFNRAKFQDLFVDASDDNPQDVTEYVLVNADLSEDCVNEKLPKGWDITIKGTNIGGRVASYTNGDVTISNFIECWKSDSAPYVLTDGDIAQTVYGLPAGKYVLEADFIACYQWSDPAGRNPAEGVSLFIETAENRTQTAVATEANKPQHFSVTFLNDGSDYLTFGLRTKDATANWIAADNFKIYYYGATTKTQAQLELETAIKDAEVFQEGLNDLFFNENVRKAFETAISNANDELEEGTDEGCLAAKQALEEKTAAVNNSIEAYKVLLSYLDISSGGKGLLDKYYSIANDCGMTELTQKWGDWKDNWEAAYEEGTMTDEDIYEKTSSIYPDLKAAWLNVKVEDVQEGTDLTWLIENADFEEGGVYTAGSGGSIPGWTIVSGDITRKDHVIEAYHRLLDFQQVIPNMPAGVYDVTLQGFVRHDDPEQNDNKSTIFYGGDSKATLMQRSDQWHATGFYLSDSQGDPCGGANKDQDITNSHGEAVKVPNGMSGFYFWEDEENTGGETMDYANWKPGDKYYTNHIKVILKADGDLTIGLKSLDTHDWIIWDNFGLAYLGQDANIYDEMIQDKLKELDKVCDPETIIITTGGQQKVEDLKDEIKTKEGTLDADTEAEYEDKIDALINYLNEGHELAISLRDDLSDYNEIRLANQDLYSNDDNGFIGWVSGMIDLFPYDDYGLLPAEDDIKDDAYKGTINNNEALQATTIDMNRRMADYVMQFAAANPLTENDGSYYGNATEAIFNPRYTVYIEPENPDAPKQNTKGWTMEVADSIKGKAIGVGSDYAEVFDCSNFVISQTVRGLYPGWYLLTVDGFYRPGLPKEEDTKKVFTPEDAQKQYVEMFAESGDLKYSHPLMNIMSNAQATSIVTGDIKVTIGENELWIPDNMASAATYLQQEVGHLVGEQEVYYQIAVNPDYGTFSYNSVYRNGMLVQVDESGVMTIGLRKEDLWVYHDWTFFGNWTLTYFGDEENIPTAVETVEAKSAKNMIQDIFTIDGRQVQRLQRGINIVRTTDGKINKVLVK